MAPTLFGSLEHGDRILANKYTYLFGDPKRGDITIFETDGIQGLTKGKDYIKRVIGLPGDVIYLEGDQVFINGKPYEDAAWDLPGFNFHFPRLPLPLSKKVPFTVPANSYFVLGDNPLNSRDSRYFGAVPRENFHGRVFAIYRPLKRARFI